jgi:hypothetical protein
MPAEQGGTLGLENNLGSYNSVPLPLQLPATDQRYDAEYLRMESWLDENPEFVQDYFIRFVLSDKSIIGHALDSTIFHKTISNHSLSIQSSIKYYDIYPE